MGIRKYLRGCFTLPGGSNRSNKYTKPGLRRVF